MKILFAAIPLAIGLAVAPVQAEAAQSTGHACLTRCEAAVPAGHQAYAPKQMQVADAQMRRLRAFEARNRAFERQKERAAMRAERRQERARIRAGRMQEREYQRDLRAFQQMERARR